MKAVWIAAPLLLLGLAGAAEAACSKSVMPGGGPRFVLKGGEAHDQKTGLVWQRCSVGLQWSPPGKCTGERGEVRLDDAREAAAIAGAPWRLPTVEELAGLIDRDCGRPTIDTRVFPDVTDSTEEGAEEYWTSTPGGINDMVYFVDFADGYGDIRSPGFLRYARLVRPAK